MTDASSAGNPIGGLVFSNAFTGQFEQLHEWTNFVAFDEFCIRGCKDSAQAPTLCNHIYDVMGCAWNMPANYDAGVFERCLGDDALVRWPPLAPLYREIDGHLSPSPV